MSHRRAAVDDGLCPAISPFVLGSIDVFLDLVRDSTLSLF